MRILLDECVPKRLARVLPGHEVRHVTDMGWVAIKNGKLLALAEQSFDVFLTVDRNLSFQQNLPRFRIAVLLIRARSNRLADLQPLIPAMLAAPPKCKIGKATTVGP